MKTKKTKIEKLQQLARKAGIAKDKFQAALEKAKESPDWERLCKESGMSPIADAGDWMS